MRPRHFLSLAPILLSLALSCSRAAGGAPTVACVGDSITQLSGWTDQLGAKLGAGHAVKNYGRSSATLLEKGDGPYRTTPQYKQSLRSNPAIVVIMLGTNDSKPSNWNAHKDEFVADYRALVDAYQALPSRPRIYLCLCPPVGANGVGISGRVIEDEINPRIRQVAASEGVGVVDVFTAFGGRDLDPSLFVGAGDQVHPNEAGARRIADAVHAALARDAAR